MKNNVGELDKLLRILLGLAIIIIGIYYNSYWGFLGVIPLVSGLAGYCPIYRLFGISTVKTSDIGLKSRN